jgi:hypothetical protein
MSLQSNRSGVSHAHAFIADVKGKRKSVVMKGPHRGENISGIWQEVVIMECEGYGFH